MDEGQPKVRMTGRERREQLVQIGRSVFADMGYDAATVEEIAQRAGVTKPVVYEHFGGKEGLYAVVVDREVRALSDRITTALADTHPALKLEAAADALLGYIDDEPDGFRLLVRDRPSLGPGTFASLISDVASQVEHIFADEFDRRGFDPGLAALYSHALIGMVVLVGEWWRETGEPPRDVVAAHLVNLAWNGLSGLVPKPRLRSRRGRGSARP